MGPPGSSEASLREVRRVPRCAAQLVHRQPVRRWGRRTGASAGLGARDLPEAAEGATGGARRGGEAEDPGRREKRALCGCGLTAGTCELDDVVPVRQAFAGSVQTLQALCGDCRSEKTLRESAQPTSLESRVAPGVMEYARSPKLPPLVFEAQACHKDALHVGVDVVRCRRNGLANAPFLQKIHKMALLRMKPKNQTAYNKISKIHRKQDKNH